MKVLIMSCNTGMGHNSCAAAMREVFEAHGADCATVDTLSFVSEKFSGLVSAGHVKIYRYLPGLFRWGYRYAEHHPGVFEDKSAIYKLLMLSGKKLEAYLLDQQFDYIVTTHVFSALILTVLLKEHPELHPVTCYISTDYTCSPSTGEGNLDYYFIPDERLGKDFVRDGVREETIVASGIPVAKRFYRHIDKKQAKQAVGVDPEKRHLLLMCGSMGCGPMRQLTVQLNDMLEEDMEVTIVCGTNRNLQLDLRKSCTNERIHVIGYTKQMPLLLDSADLYLTKPGGLSTSEASVKRLPMVFVDAVAGCEEYNMRYFMEMGAAESSKTVEGLAELCIRLLRDPQQLARMSASYPVQEYAAGEIIYQTMTGDNDGKA